MQNWGAKPWNAAASEIVSGDIMVIPLNNSAVIDIPRAKILAPEQASFATLPFITTFGRGTGASFYSGVRGPVPWAIDSVPLEVYQFARFR